MSGIFEEIARTRGDAAEADGVPADHIVNDTQQPEAICSLDKVVVQCGSPPSTLPKKIVCQGKLISVAGTRRYLPRTIAMNANIRIFRFGSSCGRG